MSLEHMVFFVFLNETKNEKIYPLFLDPHLTTYHYHTSVYFLIKEELSNQFTLIAHDVASIKRL